MAKAPKTPAPKSSRSSKRPAPALAFPRKMHVQSLTHDAIAERAYELFVASGWQHGRDVEHWLMAEQELRSSVGREAAS